MKLLIPILALLLTALEASAQSGKYTVIGSTKQIPEAEGHKIYLMDYNTEKFTDSTFVKDGKFEFRGEVTSPMVRRVSLGQFASANIVIEPGNINIDMLPVATRKQASAYGTPLNEKLSAANTLMSDLVEKLKNDTILSKEEKEKQFEQKFKIYKQACIDLYMGNVENQVGAYSLWRMNYHLTMDQFDSLLALPGSEAKEYEPIKKIVATNEKVRGTSPGKMFKDFEAKKTDNKTPVKFSDYVAKGKWVLADFWASWCGPCMQELPNVKKIHETLGDKVTVLGVNVWDKPEKCVDAIAKKEMTWESIIVSDMSATDIYGINGIPTIILFAPDGTIVSRVLRGEDMADKIAKIMAEYKK